MIDMEASLPKRHEMSSLQVEHFPEAGRPFREQWRSNGNLSDR